MYIDEYMQENTCKFCISSRRIFSKSSYLSIARRFVRREALRMNIKSPLEKRVVYTRAYTIIQNWRECEKRLDQEKIGYTKYIKYSINNLLVDRFYSGPEPLAIVLINNINYIRQVCTTPDTTYFFSLRDNKLFSHADVKKRVHSSCTNPNCPKKILGFEPQS